MANGLPNSHVIASPTALEPISLRIARLPGGSQIEACMELVPLAAQFFRRRAHHRRGDEHAATTMDEHAATTMRVSVFERYTVQRRQRQVRPDTVAPHPEEVGPTA